MSLTAIFSAIANVCALAAQWMGLKNAPQEQRAAEAKVEEKVDETNTEIVQRAIETGNLDELRK